MRVSEEHFAKLVEKAIQQIPQAFQPYLEDVAIDVEPMPSRHDLEAAGIDDPTELMGMYHGTPLTERSVESDLRLPDRISIYQRNIEAACDSEEEIIEEIHTTVLHEIGHHFGLDEDDLFEVGYD